MKSIVSAVVLWGSLGCSMLGEYHHRERLLRAIEAQGESLRWGGSKGLEGLRGARRVTNVEVRGITFNDDRDRATVRIEVEGYEMPRMVVRTWWYEQTWRDADGGWAMVSQKEVQPKQAGKTAVAKTAIAR